MLKGPEKIFFRLASAILVAKHPQPAAFGDFLKSLTPGRIDRLRSLLVSDRGISEDALERLKKMVTKQTECVAAVHRMAPRLHQSALEPLSDRRSTFTSQRDYVCTRLENLLLDYDRGKVIVNNSDLYIIYKPG
jgi:hypothetical protein